MFRVSHLIYIVFLGIFLASNQASAQSYSYPELNVVPRATQRLNMEYKWMSKNRNSVHRSIQISALTTFLAGVTMSSDVDTTKDEDEYSPKFGMFVGLAWLGTTFYLSRSYRPYLQGIKSAKKVRGNSKRAQLTRERIAEEQIRDAARFGRKLKWMSFLTNMAAAGYMSSKAKSESTGQTLSAVAALAAFTPFLFGYRWEVVEEEQERYKKKIYGPVASTTILRDPITNSNVPGLFVSLNF
jgi:hypothetical protein